MDPQHYSNFDRTQWPVVAKATDYENGHDTGTHFHPHGQLSHALQGVMVVSTDQGSWVVPPTRAMWMPPMVPHRLRTIGAVKMRMAFIRPDVAREMPQQCSVIGVSALLRELILAAIAIKPPYEADSRDGRLMRLLLDEAKQVRSLPLHLPRPADPRLREIGDAIAEQPHERTTAVQWAERFAIDPKTLHRLFVREVGMTFGQWRQQAKLMAALEMLAAGNKIVDVALDLGYASPNAFATMFKRQFGTSPSTFFSSPGMSV